MADELWERYGHHPSFYGWYVSEEKDGGLGNAEERREIVEFFREFTPHVRRLAPDKPVMLAPNCYHLRGAEETYRKLLPHLDIICPFGFHRMPGGDLTGEEAATLMQSLCDEAGCHLWMDLETFVFRDGGELHPRPDRRAGERLQAVPQLREDPALPVPRPDELAGDVAAAGRGGGGEALRGLRADICAKGRRSRSPTPR